MHWRPPGALTSIRRTGSIRCTSEYQKSGKSSTDEYQQHWWVSATLISIGCPFKYQRHQQVSAALTSISCTDEYQLHWRVLTALTSISCTDEYQLHWRVSATLTSNMCTVEYQLHWRVLATLTSNMCTDEYQLHWRVSTALASISCTDDYQMHGALQHAFPRIHGSPMHAYTQDVKKGRVQDLIFFYYLLFGNYAQNNYCSELKDKINLFLHFYCQTNINKPNLKNRHYFGLLNIDNTPTVFIIEWWSKLHSVQE